jgi:membrane associated rhomboid family serine protease
MFVPLYDGVPLRYLRFPIGNWSIIAVNVIVFLLLQAAPDPNRLETGLGAIPAVLFGTAILSPDLAIVPPPATLITGIFVHANIGHILGNMLFLWVFGDNVEDAMGSARYLGFYIACGVIAALTFSAMVPTGQSPLIGASGAISGVAAGYLLLYPKARIWGFAASAHPGLLVRRHLDFLPTSVSLAERGKRHRVVGASWRNRRRMLARRIVQAARRGAVWTGNVTNQPTDQMSFSARRTPPTSRAHWWRTVSLKSWTLRSTTSQLTIGRASAPLGSAASRR